MSNLPTPSSPFSQHLKTIRSPLLGNRKTAHDNARPIDIFETNSHLRRILCFAVSISDLDAAQAWLSSPTLLRCLLEIAQLHNLAPQNRRLVARLLRAVLPTISDLALRDIERSTRSQGLSILVDSALDTVGAALCVEDYYKAEDAGSSDASLLSSPAGCGCGSIVLSRAGELVALLRVLLSSRGWRRRVTSALRSALADVTEYVCSQAQGANVGVDENSEEKENANGSNYVATTAEQVGKLRARVMGRERG